MNKSIEDDVAELIVTTLNLEIEPQEINPEAALFRDGLGLDSIDALELAVAISKQYGIQLRSDDDDNASIFSSLRSLSRHIETNKVM